MRNIVYYIHTNIVAKKRGEKTRETIFPETHEELTQNDLKKIVGKKCETTFLNSHEYRDKKNGSEKMR